MFCVTALKAFVVGSVMKLSDFYFELRKYRLK